jgi:hypothetical protein
MGGMHQAREDTVASFRRMLESGELDDREIYVDVPIKEGSWVVHSPRTVRVLRDNLVFSSIGCTQCLNVPSSLWMLVGAPSICRKCCKEWV